MGEHPLHLAICWHMHQPFYKDLLSPVYRLPWVRLHAIKDYYDMPAMLEGFPGIRVTFNLVPSLLEQIEEYGKGATDVFLEHTRKSAAELTPTERVFVLKHFFMANGDTLISPFPRYRELLQKRGERVDGERLQRVAQRFTEQEILDLQVWFNLAWFDPMFREQDAFLRSLVEKGGGFVEAEKQRVVEKQVEVVRNIIPYYRAMAEAGRVALTTSPYYHPILPLLIDQRLAREALPDLSLPKHVFHHPEDAETQISRAMEAHRSYFGHDPQGLWPPEGSVCEAMIPMLATRGLQWTASDEEVLARSLGVTLERDHEGHLKAPGLLYRPYWAEHQGHRVAVVFRDKVLSDLIGFTYAGWDADRAADDFLNRLSKIHKAMAGSRRPPLVSVILDGENAWEFYPRDGHDFLQALYGRLSEASWVRTVTPDEHLSLFPAGRTLPRLFAGSWIHHNFSIWIGHEEDNAAWDALAAARATLVDHIRREDSPQDPETLSRAWEQIYIAEGSDWCWWYGDEHTSGQDDVFDALYRSQLMSVYTLLGKDVPDSLLVPILREERQSIPVREITAFIQPVLDGQVTHYYEWVEAAVYDVTRVGGAMHRAAGLLRAVYYGFDQSTLYLRLDPEGESFPDSVTLTVRFLNPPGVRVSVAGAGDAQFLSQDAEETWQPRPSTVSAAMEAVAEVAVPFQNLQVREGDEVHFLVILVQDGMEVERWPHRGYFAITVPASDFEARMWRV